MLKFRGKKGLAHKPVRLLMKPKGAFAYQRPFCSVFISYFLLQVLRLPVLVNFKSIYFKYPTILNRPPPSIYWPVFLFFRNIIKNDSKKLSNTVTWLRHFYCEMNLHGCQGKFSLILRRSTFSGVRGPLVSLPREREKRRGWERRRPSENR